MEIRRFPAYRQVAGACCVLGGMAVGIVGGAQAVEGPACGPGAAAAVTTAYKQHEELAASLRDYFRIHPQRYNDLRDIMAPIGHTRTRCRHPDSVTG